MVIVGIDPGKAGGIAYISPAGECSARPMPLIGKDIDGHEIAFQLKALVPDVVIVEKAQAMRKKGVTQGATSMFSYGMGFGRVLGIIEALGIPYRLVTPQSWKKVVLAGTAKDKDAAIQFCRRAFPGVDLTPGKKRVPHDGMADALCIADYGRQVIGGA